MSEPALVRYDEDGPLAWLTLNRADKLNAINGAMIDALQAALEQAERTEQIRVILLAGAEYQGRARDAMRSPGGAATEVINITSRENDLFDFMLERLIAPGQRGDRALGLHLPDRPNTVTLQLDHARTLAALARIGFPIAPPAATICHWSSYLREGVFAFYNAALRGDSRLGMEDLRRLVTDVPEPRWARVRPLPPMGLPALTGWRAAR